MIAGTDDDRTVMRQNTLAVPHDLLVESGRWQIPVFTFQIFKAVMF